MAMLLHTRIVTSVNRCFFSRRKSETSIRGCVEIDMFFNDFFQIARTLCLFNLAMESQRTV